MKLELRNRNATRLEHDFVVEVHSQEEWRSYIDDPCWVSSVLTPNNELFSLDILHGLRKHPHEKGYRDSPKINASFREGCRQLAAQLDATVDNARCLIYAPLRGALPIWRGIAQFLEQAQATVYYPVTSSFIYYPASFGILGRKGRPASGRFNNGLELQRILPFLDTFDFFVYVDEIVSGGMMKGHLKEMFQLGVHQRLPLIAVGLADGFGNRSKTNRLHIEHFQDCGRMHAFLWQGCHTLITEDQKFLLGMHYADYNLGPHAVPFLDDSLNFHPEKVDFDANCFGDHPGVDPITRGFCAFQPSRIP